MRVNLPVTQREKDYSADHMLVSVTDTRGYITHCNRAFVEVSGYRFEELMGQNHNLIRHPDMPALGFKDLWSTIGRGKPWTGLVKNRAKNGDHYWVVANVSPIMVNGKPKAYLSVRTKPSRAQIEAADALYAAINASPDPSKLPVYLKEGVVYKKGLRGLGQQLARMSLTLRLGIALGLMSAVGLLPTLLDPDQSWLRVGLQLACLSAGALGVMWWFDRGFTRGIREAQRFANELGGCNLATRVNTDFPPPVGPLIRSLQQIQINLQAVVGDVNQEISVFKEAAEKISTGSQDLSARTELQASSLEQTSVSMDQLAHTVRNTASTATQVGEKSIHSNDIASRGGQAVHAVGLVMESIDESSGKVRDIIGVIEGIAFQTNILALNAAVEAARAGEQGRGFAVVASEVRALAQRSAVAAKEIRALIAQSTDKISEGSAQMRQAAQTIDEVVQSVSEVSTMIREITDAANGQASGIAQVNQAVAQLETVTQQNVALVEQSAEAASGLQTSGDMLTRAAAVFQLPR